MFLFKAIFLEFPFLFDWGLVQGSEVSQDGVSAGFYLAVGKAGLYLFSSSVEKTVCLRLKRHLPERRKKLDGFL